MKKTIAITMLGILMLSGVLAYFPGDTIQVPNEMGIENLVYTIIGNSTTLPELNILIDTQNITITFPGDMPPDSFDIVFIEEQTNTVVQTVYRGGGGGSTRYVDRNVTIEIPTYVDRNMTTEVDKIVLIPEETKVEDGFNIWVLVLAFIFGALAFFLFIWIYNKIIDRGNDY